MCFTQSNDREKKSTYILICNLKCFIENMNKLYIFFIFLKRNNSTESKTVSVMIDEDKTSEVLRANHVHMCFWLEKNAKKRKTSRRTEKKGIVFVLFG